MKILCVSPIELPYHTGARYTGLEKLAVQFAEEWAKLGHEVSLIAHHSTNVSPKVNLLPCDGYETIQRPDHAEYHAYRKYQTEYRKHDVIWDITNLHLAARYMPNLPIANVFHANPHYAFLSGYLKAPYNLISWSKWGVKEIAKYYERGTPKKDGGQKSVYQETIMVDPEVFKPNPLIKRTDRFLTIGRMSPEKGNLNAVRLCKELNIPIDVCGGRGAEVSSGSPLTDYEKEIQKLCDGTQIVYYGEVSDEQKIELMQSCKALIYFTDHVEITSHKVQEAMLCGAPVIVPSTGGMPEIVTNDVDGFLCCSLNEYIEAIKNIGKLNLILPRDTTMTKYAPIKVAEGYITLFERIVKGERW